MSAKLIPNTTLPNLLVTLDDNPMRALRRCRDDFQVATRTHNESVHDTIAFIVAFYQRIQHSSKEQDEFLNDEYWSSKPQRPKSKNLLRLIAMFMVGATKGSGAQYQQSLGYTNVAKHFIDLGVKPTAVSESLRQKPIYKVLDEISAQEEDGEAGGKQGKRPQARVIEVGDTRVSRNGEADEEQDDYLTNSEIVIDPAQKNEDHRVPTATRPSERPLDSQSATPASLRKKFDPGEDLSIEAGRWLSHLLKYEEGETCWVRIRTLPDREGWRRFEMIDIDERQ